MLFSYGRISDAADYFYSFLSLLAIFLLLLCWHIPKSEAKGNVQNGEKAYQVCIQCHGDKGLGLKEQNAPRIAGQFDWYIVLQLNAFKDKKRENPPMYPFIKYLNVQEIEDLAAYISQLKP